MRIGIDVRLWGTQHAGIGRYVEELVKNLQAIDKKNRYVLFCREEDFAKIPEAPNFKKVVADIKHYTLAEQFKLPTVFAKEKLDVLHVPHFNVPIFYRGPFVVTIHDLLWHEVRGLNVTTQTPLVYSIKYLAYRFVVKNAVLRAKKILVPSNFVKQDLIKRFNIPGNKVVATYEAAS